MTDFHSKMINLEIPKGVLPVLDRGASYRLGHKDARHAAAEIALEADSEIEELRLALLGAASTLEIFAKYSRDSEIDDVKKVVENIEKVLWK